jgi:hypothetical protein
MSMGMVPQLIQGLACPVCGVLPSAGVTHAYQKTIIDVGIKHSSPKPDMSTPSPCPKCGVESYPSWFIIKIGNRYFRRQNPRKDIVAGPFTIWHAKEVVKKMNKGDVL